MTDYADLFTNAQMDGIKRSGIVSDTFFERLVEERKQKIKSNIDTMGYNPADVLKRGLKREEQMLYKVRVAKNEQTGRYEVTRKRKKSKDIVNHIHHDAFKRENFAQLVDADFLISFAQLDRDFTRLPRKDRKALQRAMKAVTVSGHKYDEETRKRVQEALDYIENPKGAKDFMGEDPRPVGKPKKEV
jgi:hypothetical protein